MRHFTKAVFVSFFVLVSLFGVAVAAQAQTQATPEASADGETTLLATVNIYDATFTQNGNNLTISFDLTNRVGVQPEVKYSVLLINETETGQTVVDQHVYDEVLNLGENSSVHKVVTYTPPQNLSGKFLLILMSNNTSGFPFGSAQLGTVTLKSTGQGSPLVIDAASCYLTVVGEKGAPHYTPLQGVDIARTENLESHCVVENTANTRVTFTPTFVTRSRSAFGDIVVAQGGDTSALTLSAYEKKEVTTLLPKSILPQAYNVDLTYTSAGVVSNKMTYHYVIQGGSGTIQSISLDKDTYKTGETADLSFIWTASADTFPDSRIGTGTTLTAPAFTVSLVDKYGNTCAVPVTKVLGEELLVHTPIAITASCVHPKANVTLTDAVLGTLSERSFTTATTTRESAAPTATTTSQVPSQTNLLYPILALLAALLFGLGIYYKKSTSVPPVPPLAPLLLLFMTVVLLGSPLAALADTFIFTLPGGRGSVARVTATINLDKRIYSPGETITASGVAYSIACGNLPRTQLSATINGVTKNIISPSIGVSGFNTFTAQSVGGSYIARFDTVSIYTPASGFIPYTVTAPVVPVVNCTGSWNNNSVCSVSGACGQTGTIQQTFTQTTAASGGGLSCTATYGGENGATRWGSTPCSTGACPVPVNCVGSWSNTGVCSVSGACGQTGTIQQRFTQTTAASSGGSSCTAIYGGENGATRWGSTACSTGACPVPVVVPTVISPTAISITSTGATLGATVTSNGGAALTARGTCWGTTPAPITNCLAEGGLTVVTFTHPRSGMPPSTTIYYRGYATNSAGTGYSVDGSFATALPPNTPPNAPTITGPSTGFPATNYTFTFRATDPNGDTIHYEIDWDNNGTVDQTLPAGFIPSGTAQSQGNNWSGTGAKNFEARAVDSRGGVSGWTSHTITITPPPTLSVSPTNMDFGNVAIGEIKDSTTMNPSWITITNTGGGSLNITGITQSAHFTCLSGCAGTLGAGLFQLAVIRLNAPASTGPLNESITVNSDAGSQVVTVNAMIIPVITIMPGPLDFGGVVLNKFSDKVLTINNNSSTITVPAGSITVAEPFSCATSCAYPIVPPGGSATIVMRYTPTALGLQNGVGTLSTLIQNNTGNLVGTGLPITFDVRER